MLLAITLGIMCAMFVMVVLWCRAAMKAAQRRAEAAAKKRVDAQTWAAKKASRRKAQNDLLDRLTADAEAAKPILAAPIKAADRAPSHDDDSPVRASFSMPSIPSFDYAAGSSDNQSCSVSSDSGGAAGGCE